MGRRNFVLKPGHPEQLQIQLVHFKQKFNWDCGISCVLMCLPRKHRQHLLRNFLAISKEEGFLGRTNGNVLPVALDLKTNRVKLGTCCTWTIDLCYLLKRYDIKHVFHTVTLGIHPGYRGNTFYNNFLTKDEARVNQRFNTASQDGVEIERASLTVSQILDHLIQGPAIILVNSRLLNCDVCKLNKISSELRKCIPWPTPYQGHFIVLCGYEQCGRKVYYRNPSFADRICVMSISTLEEARKAYGTDEDIILVRM